MALKTEFKLVIKVLTPLHIGTGQVLQRDFDYVVREGRTLRIHEGRFLEWVSTRGEHFARLTQGVPPGQILGQEVRPGSPLVRYALPGEPQNTRELRECVKDAFDRPYIPASSLKGALRTVLFWRVWREKRLRLVLDELKQSPRFAASSLEKGVFGPSPHMDLLRALRLHDSSPAGVQNLCVVNVRCISQAARNGIPLALEAVVPETTFLVEGHIDEAAFRPWGPWHKPGFLPKEKRALLDWKHIAEAARAKARARLDYDLRWAQQVGIHLKPWQDLREQLERSERGELQGFPLQIGFGTGWLGMTLGPALLSDPAFPSVYKQYRLGQNPRTRRQTPLQRFPASRRLARLNALDMPLGWIWVTPKEGL